MAVEILPNRAARPASPRRLVDAVKRLRWALPVAIFLTVVVHQAWMAVADEQWPPMVRFIVGVLFYGLVGPAVTYWTLDWIARAIEAREAMASLKAKNEALEVANEYLQQLDALKDEFVSLVSHELRAPLTNINASVELLLARRPADGAREKLEIIGHEAQRLTRLVQGVLDVSRMEAGRLDLQRAPVDPDQLCHAAVMQLGETGHTWNIEIARGAPAVLADADRAVQVLGNLLANAVKYSPPGSRVDLAARPAPDGAAVLFSVSDRGAGIPPDEVDRIFERFHRVERGDARETYGHGLGLYIARKIVEAHSGRIWVESTPGVGSTFLFTLPAAPEEP